MKMFVFSSHFHSDYPALTIFSMNLLPNSYIGLLLSMKLLVMHSYLIIWQHRNGQKSQGITPSPSRPTRFLGLLHILPGDQKRRALAVLYAGCFSEFPVQQTTWTGGMMSLLWMKSKFTHCTLQKQRMPHRPRVPQQTQSHVRTASSGHSVSPPRALGTRGKGYKYADVWTTWHAPVCGTEA